MAGDVFSFGPLVKGERNGNFASWKEKDLYTREAAVTSQCKVTITQVQVCQREKHSYLLYEEKESNLLPWIGSGDYLNEHNTVSWTSRYLLESSLMIELMISIYPIVGLIMIKVEHEF